MNKHTPGPWTIHEWSDGGLTVVGGDGEDVAEVSGHFEDDEETYPNARLIGAVPDLLEAAKAFTEANSASIARELFGFDGLTAAIAKAEEEA